MLPDHVVSALKAKYETSNGLLALSRELEVATGNEGCGERGLLTRLMEAPYDEFQNMAKKANDHDKTVTPRGSRRCEEEVEKKVTRDVEDAAKEIEKPASLVGENNEQEMEKLVQEDEVEGKLKSELEEEGVSKLDAKVVNDEVLGKGQRQQRRQKQRQQPRQRAIMGEVSPQKHEPQGSFNEPVEELRERIERLTLQG
ncbi:hypothetical protein ACHAXA_011637 [Cyclostephanos tholiformis]|uniref:Uncharacterized protein n=1 Tax=Cyclostephanos tholiformis TaxID=382380 RepID=A0ABD3RV92_9STRA